jgi:hypothetical protein
MDGQFIETTIPVFGLWERVKITWDGQGYVYVSDPLLAQVYVFDSMGELVHTFEGINSRYLIGIPSGGIFAFSPAGSTSIVSRLLIDKEPDVNILTIDRMFTSGFASSGDRFVLCMADGDIEEFTISTNHHRTIVQHSPLSPIRSSVIDSKNAESFWLLDSNHRILFWDGQNLTVAAQAFDGGFLLYDSLGILYMSMSGKRFHITDKTSPVSDWLLF